MAAGGVFGLHKSEISHLKTGYDLQWLTAVLFSADSCHTRNPGLHYIKTQGYIVLKLRIDWSTTAHMDVQWEQLDGEECNCGTGTIGSHSVYIFSNPSKVPYTPEDLSLRVRHNQSSRCWYFIFNPQISSPLWALAVVVVGGWVGLPRRKKTRLQSDGSLAQKLDVTPMVAALLFSAIPAISGIQDYIT